MPTFCPIDDQVLVRRPPAEGSQGKLVIPDRAQERPLTGEVLAVGPGRAGRDGTRSPVAVRVGDQVLVAKYAGDEVELDGVACLVVRADDLLGVLEPDPQRYRLSDGTEGEWSPPSPSPSLERRALQVVARLWEVLHREGVRVDDTADHFLGTTATDYADVFEAARREVLSCP